VGEFVGFELFGGGGAFASGFGGCEGFGFGGAVVGLFAAAAETVLGHSGGGHGVVVGTGWPAWRRGLWTGGGRKGGQV
jgi:hypothetical protein